MGQYRSNDHSMLNNISGSPAHPSEGQGLHSKAENTEIDWFQADGSVGCTGEGESSQDQGTRVLAWEGMPSRQVLGEEFGTRVCSTHACTADNRLESLTHPTLLDAPYSSGEDTNDGQNESVIEPQSVPSDNLSPYEVSDSESECNDVVAYDTETSHPMTVADRHWLQRKQWFRCKRHEHQHQKDHQAREATLLLFKNSSKEGATMYIDWRNSVHELITDKLDKKRIWSLVLQSLEGPMKDTAHLAYKMGRGVCKTFYEHWISCTADRVIHVSPVGDVQHTEDL